MNIITTVVTLFDLIIFPDLGRSQTLTLINLVCFKHHRYTILHFLEDCILYTDANFSIHLVRKKNNFVSIFDTKLFDTIIFVMYNCNIFILLLTI